MMFSVVETTEELQETLVKAKVYMGLATALFSYMLYRTNIQFTDDEKISTVAATITKDGNFIYINTKFWLSLTDKQRAFLLLHEVAHIFLEHPIRSKENAYNNDVYNNAADYYINLMATGKYSYANGKVSTNERYAKYLEFIDGGLLDEQYMGMSADEIYFLLMEQAEELPQSIMDGDIISADGMFCDISEEVHNQIQRNRVTAIEAIVNAESSQQVGENEGNIVRMFQNLVKPKIHWTEHLQNTFVKNKKERTTYKRYNRKSNEVIFPTYEGNHINVVFGIDTSGSMSKDDITRAVSELSGLLETYDSWKLHLATADAKVYVIGVYESSIDGFNDIDFSKMLGGGGTKMSVIVDYAREVNHEDEINTCIILTDGYLFNDDLNTLEDFGIITVVTESGNKSYENNKVEVIHV